MFVLFVILHVLAGLVLIGVVLLQSGKAGDLASAFGGASSQTAFGARGAATFLTKATTLCAVVFMGTSLGLSILFTRGPGSSVMEEVDFPQQVEPAPEAERSVSPYEDPLLPSGEDSTPAGR